MRVVNRTLRCGALLTAAALLTLAGLPIGAQELPGTGNRALSSENASDYRLKAADYIAVSVTPEREFSRYNRQTKVRVDGKVELYKVGEFAAATRTLKELEDAIEAQLPLDPKSKTKGEVAVKLLSGSYELRKGDQISITVSSHKEYDAEAIVLPDGSALLRNVCATPALHKTLAALALDIRYDLITVEDLVNPKVAVTLVRAAPEEAPKAPARRLITISGAVAVPGPVDFEEGLTIQRALVLAGGSLREANLQDIRVYPRMPSPAPSLASTGSETGRRPAVVKPEPAGVANASSSRPDPRKRLEPGGFIPVAIPEVEETPAPKTADSAPMVNAPPSSAGKPQKLLNADLPLLDGDAIEVRFRSAPVLQQSTVRVSGLVRTPGLINLTPNMRLEDLFKEGGLSPMADPKKVQVYRNGERVTFINSEKNTIEGSVDLQAEIQAQPPDKLILEPGDEVYVPKIGDAVIVIGGVQTPGWRPLRMVERTVDGQTVLQGQTIREFFLQSDKEVTAGNQDLPSTYNPNFAELKNVEVIRNGKVEKVVNLIEVTRKESRPDNIVLQPGDVIYLPPKGRPNRGALTYLRELPYLGFLFGLF